MSESDRKEGAELQCIENQEVQCARYDGIEQLKRKYKELNEDVKNFHCKSPRLRYLRFQTAGRKNTRTNRPTQGNVHSGTLLMLETSFQAKFLIPMGLSIAGGLIFATVLTLLAIPSLYLILLDVRSLFQRGEAAIPVVTARGVL